MNPLGAALMQNPLQGIRRGTKIRTIWEADTRVSSSPDEYPRFYHCSCFQHQPQGKSDIQSNPPNRSGSCRVERALQRSLCRSVHCVLLGLSLGSSLRSLPLGNSGFERWCVIIQRTNSSYIVCFYCIYDHYTVSIKISTIAIGNSRDASDKYFVPP